MKLHRIQYAGSSLTLKFSGTMLSTRITSNMEDFSSSMMFRNFFPRQSGCTAISQTLVVMICGKIAPHRCRNSVRH